MRIGLIVRVVLADVIGLLPSCTSGARQEAQQVSEAMDRFRKADNEQPSLVGTLRAVKCQRHGVCKTRDACLASPRRRRGRSC